jgi:hypothetical protein
MAIVAGLFERFEDADRAVHDLEHFGYCSGNIHSIPYEQDPPEKFETDRATTALPAVAGAICGGLTGLLIGIGPLSFPELEAAISSGVLTALFASTTVGAGFGAVSGGLLGALVRFGIPAMDAKVQIDGIRHDRVLVTVEVSSDLVPDVDRIFRENQVIDLETKMGRWN